MWDLDCEERWVTKNWCFWTHVHEFMNSCWRRLLRVPWTAMRSNQSILKEISPGCHWKDWCWNWNSNTLATWCKELTHWKRLWCWEGLGAGGEGDDRGWDGWMASLTRWAWVWVDSRNLWWTGRPGSAAIHGVAKSWTQLIYWTELNWYSITPEATRTFLLDIILFVITHILVSLCFTLLPFTNITSFFPLPVAGLWQSCNKQVYRHHFSNRIGSYHVSLSHFANFHILNIFIMVYFYGNLWSVVFDVTMAMISGVGRVMNCAHVRQRN